MTVVYQVVTEKGTQYYQTVQELAEAYPITGYRYNDHARSELQGQPILEGLLGPMYNGLQSGVPVIRYETQRVYDILSR